MIDEWRTAYAHLGHEVQVVELDGRLPDPDQASIYAARTTWAALPADSVRLIDGMALQAFGGLPLHQVTALVHHPASLETGLPDEAGHRLHATEVAMFQELPRLVVTSDQTAHRLDPRFRCQWGTDQRHHSRDRRSATLPLVPPARLAKFYQSAR